MSQRFEALEERLAAYESQIDIVYRLYHIPVLVALMAFMLWVRVRDYTNHIGPNGEPLYTGNDGYYHYRSVNYVLENYPYTMPFDPWTGFDVGRRAGQFGTIFDQAVATVALVVGLGSPSQETVVTVTLFAAPVVATLCAIPMYYVGKRLGGRFGGIVAVVILALTPGMFLTRSVAGSYDHQIVEAFFSLVVLAVGMKLLAVAQREAPIYEFIRTREFELLRRPVAWGLALGVALTLAVLNWPPAIFLFGLFGIFLFFALSIEFLRGHSPDHIAIPTVVAMVTAAVLIVPFLQTTGLQPTDYSIAHPLLALAVAAGTVFMAGTARLWDREELPRAAYPFGVAGAGLVGVGVLAVVAPDTLGFFLSQLERVAGLGTTDTVATIGEAQAPSDPLGLFYRNYGLGFYTAVLGVLLVVYRVVSRTRPRADYLLVAVYGALMLLFTLTQNRFEIHFVIAVAAANAYVVGWVYQFVDLQDVRTDIAKIKPYQILIVVAILAVIAGPLVATGATLSTADAAAQPGEMEQWGESLDWLSEETPEVGAYGSGGDRSLEYYGTYDEYNVGDDFEYGDGDYGVLAWWDYGHYITTRGERIPVANPFQQHATESADFLLADEETEALEILDEDQPDGEGVQYVMVDYPLGYAGTQKYNAPTAFESRHNVTSGDVGIQVVNEQGQRLYGAHTQRGYESMRVRLYQHHGSAQEAGPVTVNFGEYSPTDGVATLPEGAGGLDDLFTQHDSVEAAREAAENDPTVVHGGVLGQQAERTEALEHFRLVHAGGPTTQSPFDRLVPGQTIGDNESWVKTFERVDGATVEGSGPENTEVRASVEMEIGATNETFTYTQYADTDGEGNFEMTLPYSTTGYDEYGPETGHTNVSVRANSSYQFVAPEAGAFGQANVTEGQVVGEDESPVTVELETPQLGPGVVDGTGGSADGDTTGSGTADGDTTSGGDGTAPESRVVAAG